MYIFFSLFILTVICDDILWENNGVCNSDRYKEYCFPDKDNFIIHMLSKITMKDKLIRINQKISYYTNIQIKVQEVQNKGLGVISQQDIYPGQIIFKYKLKNIIGSKQVNQNMFFHKQITLNHKNICINKRKLSSINIEQSQSSKFLFKINLLYHFSRFVDSFLMEDLLGISTESTMVPLLKITPYEFSLFKNNLEYLKIKIKEYRQNNLNDYILFVKAIDQIITKEQFTYYFGKETITLDEFLYLNCIISTRPHNIKNDRYLLPIQHYINQATNIYIDEYKQQQSFIENHFSIISTNITQYKGNEFLTNYHYSNIFVYAFQSGFVPNIIDQHCYLIEIFNEKQANKFSVNRSTCLNDQTMTQYTLLQLNNIGKDRLNFCFQSQHQIMKQYEDGDPIVFQKKLWKACYQAGLDVDFWEAPYAFIQKEKQKLVNHINEIQSYIQIRKNHHKSSQIGELLLKIQEYFYQKLNEEEQKLISFLQTNIFDN